MESSKRAMTQDDLMPTKSSGEFPKAINHPTDPTKSWLVKSAEEEARVKAGADFAVVAPAKRPGRAAKAEAPELLDEE